ncbi:head-tail connector protein [Parabacteroides pacaensis]|uniref:head-tail connector protein n=1 Tax=Parabacteroides pacaensis TaxID=2086575 RepID=UPI000D1144FB|nr:head-tail connector protein [Parabacteroides pacaensis]
MGLYVTVEDLKQHLNIDYEGEEGYLVSLIETAEVSVETYIRSPLTEYEKDGKLNPMLVHAIKIFAGNLYANREAVAFVEPRAIPYTLDYLLQPFKKYS